MSEIRAIGIDPSFTGTGLVLMDRNGPLTWKRIPTRGHAKMTDQEKFLRMQHIAWEIDTWLASCMYPEKPQIAILEGISYGSVGTATRDLAGLWWRIYGLLVGEWNLNVLNVPPMQRAKYLTGSGVSGKKFVLSKARHCYGDWIDNDDVADAAGLAAMGLRLLGDPFRKENLDPFQLEAFDAFKAVA